MNDANQTIRETGIIAILRGFDEAESLAIADALTRGGVRTVEITANTDRFERTLASVADAHENADTVIGAGTILDAETARAAITAGAKFLVTPTFSEEVVTVGNRYGVPVLTGVMTPTEALAAYEAGSPMCKVFPARSLGPGFVSALSGPLPQIPLVPTGGVNRENASAFFEAGATALGIGSSLSPTAAVSAGDFDAIEAIANEFTGIAEAYLDG